MEMEARAGEEAGEEIPDYFETLTRRLHRYARQLKEAEATVQDHTRSLEELKAKVEEARGRAEEALADRDELRQLIEALQKDVEDLKAKVGTRT
jgi:peptidoglycan hydrolase CwlO-like protein